jgi:hypothetical protein
MALGINKGGKKTTRALKYSFNTLYKEKKIFYFCGYITVSN